MVIVYGRPRLRDVQWHSKSIFAAFGFSVVMFALPLTKVCCAFAPSISTTTSLTAPGLPTTLQRRVAVPAQALAEVGQATRGAAPHCFGYAAFIVACVVRKVQGRRARKPRRAVTLCKALPVFAEALDVAAAGEEPAVLHLARGRPVGIADATWSMAGAGAAPAAPLLCHAPATAAPTTAALAAAPAVLPATVGLLGTAVPQVRPARRAASARF
eukprot:CAMPEP_0204590366 /NCGR_PEP_ID=MMETSP0661-20131031/49749_1 /ASSEMBLY_ACC=CAM_ASM_000606 /TAXON_ID=109239 /ORGANISM="Alexandrium margalefi, Strain AMGDE01CS-322" /LENGTH=213 /DNA_ID=CAMNT_0051600389 /DNA_START=46 /DNA_END=684 /DNA_ORIENTATION=+